jgi:hypothetical protein
MTAENNWLNSRPFILLFLFSSAYFFLFVRILWRIGDEGILVYGAQLVTQGALPSRDFFEGMGPASFYWLGFFFKLFGTNIIVARTVLLFTGAFTIVLIYWMTQRVYKGPFAVMPSLFFLAIGIPLWPGTSHHWDSNFFTLLAVGAFFLWQDRKRWWLLALSGVLTGLTSCFIQQKGLYIILAFVLVVWCNGYRAGQAKRKIVSDMGTLLTGYVGVGCIVLLFFYLSGGLYDLIYANLIWPISSYSNVNVVPYGFGLMKFYFPYYLQIFRNIAPSPINQALGTIILIPLLVIFFLPLLLLCVTSVACFHRSTRGRIFSAHMLPYWTTGCALWFSELPRKDIIHLIYGSPLLSILLFVIWDYCFRNKRILKSIGIGIVTVSIIFFGSYNALVTVSANQKIVSRRGVLYGFKEDPALNFLIEKTIPGDYVFVYPYYPIYYFLANIRNPTRYNILIGNFHTDAQFNEVIEDLKRKHVKYVLWDILVSGANLKTWFPQYEHTAKGTLHLEQYLEDHYEVIDVKNGFEILQIREDKLSN